MLLQTHFTRLLERGRREHALGALQTGLEELATLVAAHPELALKAHALLSEQDDALAGHVGTGNGRAVALILARLIDEIRPRPEANGFNQRHHPMAAAALRLDIPKMRADIAAEAPSHSQPYRRRSQRMRNRARKIMADRFRVGVTLYMVDRLTGGLAMARRGLESVGMQAERAQLSIRSMEATLAGSEFGWAARRISSSADSSPNA